MRPYIEPDPNAEAAVGMPVLGADTALYAALALAADLPLVEGCLGQITPILPLKYRLQKSRRLSELTCSCCRGLASCRWVLWGLSFSFTRMAVENGGTPLGIAFWQTIISSVILLSFSSLRGRHFTLHPHHIGPFIIIALLGVALPGVAFYIAASRVPSGVLAITVTLVPILTYCMALGLRIEAFSMIRISGVLCGTIAILLLVLQPTACRTPPRHHGSCSPV